MRIGVNCGHTVSGQPGCGAIGFLNESNETRKVGYALMVLLRKAGHIVHDCTDDYAVSTSANLSKIVDEANTHPLDLFVSIHFNAGGGKGTEVYTYGGEQHREASEVCLNLYGLGFENRGVKDGSNLYVVRKSEAKAILIEVCFVDTKSDAEQYKHIGPERIAAAIANAITGESVANKKESEDEDMTNEEFERRLKAVEAKVGQTHEIYNYNDDNMPKWNKDDVQWMMDRGILVGDDKGKLGLSPIKLWTISIIVRTAKHIIKLMGMKP